MSDIMESLKGQTKESGCYTVGGESHQVIKQWTVWSNLSLENTELTRIG